MTEFAFTFPLLVILLVAIIATAWLGFSLVSITSAARMGARHMATFYDVPQDPSKFPTADAEITYIVTSTMPMLDWTRAEVTLRPEDVNDRVPGIQLSVEVVYSVNWPTIQIPYVAAEGALVLLPPINLHAVSRMRLD
jgi:hypothetical protein